MPTLDEHFDEFFNNVDVAIEEWQKFQGQSAQITKAFEELSRVGKLNTVQTRGGPLIYTRCDIGVYSDLDAAIEKADQSLERHMLAIHEMKAAFDKAMQLVMAGEHSLIAEKLYDKGNVVEASVAQAVAAKGAWDQGLSAAMPAYRKFKILSTQS